MSRNKQVINFAMGECPKWLADAICKELTDFIGKKVDWNFYIGRQVFDVEGTENDAEVCRAWLDCNTHCEDTFSASFCTVYDDTRCDGLGAYHKVWNHEWSDYIIHQKISDTDYILVDNYQRQQYDINVTNCEIGLKKEHFDKESSTMFCESWKPFGTNERGYPLIRVKVKNTAFRHNLLREFKINKEKAKNATKSI